MKKKLLFVINTLSRAGAENALLELLRHLDPGRCEIDLFVLLSQGELVSELPSYVRLLNKDYDSTSVLSRAGKGKLIKKVLRCACARGTCIKLFPYIVRNFFDILRRRTFDFEKVLWRVLSDGAPRFDKEYDLAVGYLEGGSTYYVADHVHAAKKAAFVHTDYTMAGYTRKLDLDCYRKMDRIFTVSNVTRSLFANVYPEHEHKLDVFYNILNASEIREKSRAQGGFGDGYEGTRILTVGRLTALKAFEVSIEAMKLLKDAGGRFRWYVLGDGDQRKFLEQKIRHLGLTEDFILCGAADNPYPYLAETDLYVHCSRFEGKSIAIQEAQILGRPVLASNCSGNRENVSDGEDGRLCSFTPEAIRDGILWLMDHPEERARYAEAAAKKYKDHENEADKLISLIGDKED